VRHVPVPLSADSAGLALKEGLQNLGATCVGEVRMLLFPDADVWSPDPLWLLRARAQCEGPDADRLLVQMFTQAVDTAEPSAFAVAMAAGVPLSGAPEPWQWQHPGYAWACTQALFRAAGGWNPWGIPGCGDVAIADEFLATAPHYRGLGARLWWQGILRAVPACRCVALPSPLIHEAHGLHAGRGYEQLAALVEWDGRPLDQLVALDAHGLPVWRVGPDDQLRRWYTTDRQAAIADPRAAALAAGLKPTEGGA
jgi:hypothetical protein